MNNKNLQSDEQIIADLLREKLSTYRPDVHAKERIYANLVTGKPSFSALSIRFVWNNFKRAVTSTALSVLILVFGFTSAYAYYSPEVTSESPLYFLKKGVEKVEYTVALDEEEKVKKLIKFNEKRKNEIFTLEKKGVESPVALQEIKNNKIIANELIEEIQDQKVKQDLYVLVNPAIPTLANPVKPIRDIPKEEEPGKIKPPVVVDKPKEKPPLYVDIPAAVVLPKALELQVPAIQDGLGGGFDVFEESISEKSMPVCKNECESGIEKCDGELVKACGDFDGDGCLEWGACFSPKLPAELKLNDFEWSFDKKL